MIIVYIIEYIYVLEVGSISGREIGLEIVFII